MKRLFSILFTVGLIIVLIACLQLDSTTVIQRDSWEIAAVLATLSVGPSAFTIKEFCTQHRISVSFFYLLRHRGEGPVEMRVGARTLISAEAAFDWRRTREAAAAAGVKRKFDAKSELTSPVAPNDETPAEPRPGRGRLF